MERYLPELAVYPEKLYIRRWQNGEVIGGMNLLDLQKFGGPYVHLYRANLQKALYEAALENGARYYFNSKVVDIDPTNVALTVQSGEVFRADLVVATDGLDLLQPKKSFYS